MSVTRFDSRVASAISYELGEGPRWDIAGSKLLWLDILNGVVLEGIWDGVLIHPTGERSFDGPVGCAARSSEGELAVALENRLVAVSPGGLLREGPALFPALLGRRANDGACDPRGRLVVGSKGPGPELLVRVETDGSVTVLDDDLTLSNGIGWSLDGSTMYLSDTLAGIIWCFEYDSSEGKVAKKSLFHDSHGAYPDGLCIDTEGNLWVAIWGTGEVRCLSPRGDLLHTVEVDAPHVSSVAFIGAGLDVLAITTAREGLSGEELVASPHSGKLFVARVPAVGLPQTVWEGSGGWRAHDSNSD